MSAEKYRSVHSHRGSKSGITDPHADPESFDEREQTELAWFLE